MGRLRIFLCYRRDDTRWVAGRLYDELRQRYGHEQVFQDVTAIRPGSRYTDQIQEEISRCDVLVVVMGEGWSSATDRQGRRRLDSSHDLVRLEIAAALQRRIPIIPVLVQGASMPADVELPDDIADLALYHACEVTDTRWEYDVGVLLTAIDGLAGGSVPAETSAVGERAGTIRRQQAKRDAEREADAKAEEQAERPGRGRITPPGRPRLALLLVMALGLAAVAVGVIYGRDGAEPQVATTGGPSTRGSTQTTRPPSTTSFAVGGDSWKATKIFEDRFSDRKAGWETVDNATHTLGYKNGAYEVTAKQPGNHVAFPRADPQLSSPDDVVIGVRARRLAGTRGNGYGITFRYRDSRNYYWFNITNEGGRSLNKIVNGNWVRLVWPKVTDGIISPTGLNHIEVMCTESGGGSARLVVWVNGKQLVDYTDKDPLEPGGRVGLFGYNAGEGPSRWTYDDFSVWELRG